MEADWTIKCGMGPLVLVLGRLYLGPASPDDLAWIAEALYSGNSCWTPSDVEHTINMMKAVGIIHEDRGSLTLSNSLHPVERSLAERAAAILRTLGFAALNSA